jgi:transposase
MSQDGSPTTCASCEQLRRENDRLRAAVDHLQQQVLDLRQRLDQHQRDAKRQAAPFRRRQLPDNPKKPGRPKGHACAARPAPAHIDRVIDVPCDTCPDCHVPLVDKVVHVQYQTDLPPITPVVTQFNIHAGRCPGCGTHRQGRHAEQTSDAVGAAANQVGPVLLTMAAELKHRLGVPYRKIVDFFTTYYDIDICPATLVRAEQRLAERARPTYELLRDALRRCGVVHADETGWRIGRVNAWLWVFSSATVTIYAIRTSRGHEVPEEILGADFDGWLVVDGFACYDVLDYKLGRCNGHLLRRCRDLLGELSRPAEVRFVERLVALLREAIDLAKRRQDLTAAGYRRRVAAIERRLDEWLDDWQPRFGPAVDRLHTHVANHRGEWLVFLEDPAVPPTNNHAEQMLRGAVITRKVGGCNKTLWGALVHGILASVMASCVQQGKRFLDLALRLWHATEAQAIPLEVLPDG